MARAFPLTTAEQLLAVVQAVVVHGKRSTISFITEFADLTEAHAKAALALAADMSLVSTTKAGSIAKGPLSPLLDTHDPARRAAVLRILLETYEPFLVFRERLLATDSAIEAASQTKALLGLDTHPQEIKDTLLSLGTYSRAILGAAGGQYSLDPEMLPSALQEIADHCGDLAAAEARIRTQIGAPAIDNISTGDVIRPLATAILRANGGDGVGAVVNAGNAVESFLDELAAAMNVSVVGAIGINARLERFQTPQRVLPRKLDKIGRYLGHIRNAADHGTGDPDVGNASWEVRAQTGLEYVFVACTFISVCWKRHTNVLPPEI